MFETNEASSERFRNLFSTLDIGASSYADIFSQSFSNVNTPRKGLTILFSSKLAAKEASYMLRSSWDECNAVTITQPDFTLLQTVLTLLKLELGCEEAEYCYSEDFCDTLAYSRKGIFSRYFMIDISPQQGMSLSCARTSMREDSYFDACLDNYNIFELLDL